MTLQSIEHSNNGKDRMLVTLVVLQDCIMGELFNAIDIANESQDSFKFTLYPKTVSFEIEKYKFPTGAYNLMKAAHDLVKKRASLRKLIPQNLVFITSYPDSDPSYYEEFKGRTVEEELSQCLFLEREDYKFGSIRLISTFIWEKLPLPENYQLQKSPSGRRVLQPYLLLMLASVALDLLVDISYHEETQGCPFDYCNDVKDIDQAFLIRDLCNDHDQFLKSKVKEGLLSKEQYFSFMGLINRAFGKPARFKWDVAISFAGSERDLAHKLADRVIEAGFKPFFDDYSALDLWGENLTTYLNNVYNKDARYCLIIVSKDYKTKMWTNHERLAAQSRAVRERGKGYILPISIDGTKLDGLYEDIAYLDLRKLGLDKIAEILIEKIDP